MFGHLDLDVAGDVQTSGSDLRHEIECRSMRRGRCEVRLGISIAQVREPFAPGDLIEATAGDVGDADVIVVFAALHPRLHMYMNNDFLMWPHGRGLWRDGLSGK